MPKYSESKRFYLRHNPLGFGYDIMDKGENKGLPYKRLFHTSSKEQVKGIFEAIEENHTVFPEPENDWEPQLLKIETKHYNYNYYIKSPEHLNEICFNFCKEHHGTKYTSFTKWELPEEYTNIIDEDVIDKFPDAEFRKKMKEQNERNKKQQKDYEEHNRIIDLADKIIGENLVHRGYYLLQNAEFLYYSFEFKTFDN